MSVEHGETKPLDARVAPTAPRAAGAEGRAADAAGGKAAAGVAGAVDAPAAGAASAAARRGLTPAQGIGAGVAALVCVAVIGVSAFFLTAPAGGGEGDGADGAQALLQTTAPGGDAVADSAAAGDAAQADAAADAADAQAAGEGDGAAVGADGASGASGGASAGAQNPSSGSGSGGASAPSQGSQGSSGAQGGGSASETPAPSVPDNVVTVTVSVTSSTVGSPVSGSMQLSFGQDVSVYDALYAWASAQGVSVNATESPMGVYVNAIGGLAEFQHGGESGWKFSVNGVDSTMACNRYLLSDGDSVAWRYVLSTDG